MRRNLGTVKRVTSVSAHDVKLELDERCQRLIEGRLCRAYPWVAVLGEEGVVGGEGGEWRWVVDPIDGTVNYTYGIPHACVSIGLQRRGRPARGARGWFGSYRTVVGVVFDPFCEELWTAVVDRGSRLNGRRVRVSDRRRMREAMITVGFAKHRASLDRMLRVFVGLVHRVMKLRIMGSAALALAYVAGGRFDGYIESGVRVWDLAAGALLVEEAGGRFECWPLPGDEVYGLVASNRSLHRGLGRGLVEGDQNHPPQKSRGGRGFRTLGSAGDEGGRGAVQ
jgi:myo-inositol-1(or 4)-monophosphatase